MQTVDWKNEVQVVVAELTRREQLDMWREFGQLPDDISELELNAWIDAALASRSVCGLITPKGQVNRYDSEEDRVHLTVPLTTAQFDGLPASLAHAIALAAGEANRFLVELMFKKNPTTETTTTPSAPA